MPAAAATKLITVAQQADEGTLDPNMLISGTGLNVVMNMFDTLLHRDAEGNLEPSLALSAEPLTDTVWEIVLRPDVTFHNGEPFDATSVKATLDRVRDPESQSPQTVYVSNIARVDIVDSHTIHIETKTPEPALIESLLMVPIGPVEYIAEHGLDHYARNPVGTGPFRFVEWQRGERVVLEAYDDHWRGRSAIDRIVFRVIPETSSIIAALLAGEVDIIVNVPPEQLSVLERNRNTKVLETESSRTIAIALPTTKSPFTDKRVRQALNYGVNVAEIVEFLFDGYAREVPTFHAPLYFGYNPDLEPYGYDPQRAKELLAEAGYPNGFDGVLYTPVGRYPKDKEVAEVIAGQLQQIGIRLNVTPLEWGRMIAMYNAHQLTEPFLMGYGTPMWDSGAGFLSRMHSDSYSSYYNNAEVDELIELGLATVDRETRESIYHRINELIYEDPSHIFLYQQVDLYGVNARVQWQPSPDERIWLFGADVE